MIRKVVSCDRCGIMDYLDKQDRASAGRLFAAALDGGDRVGTSETPADLCGRCMDDLVAFMTLDQEEAEE